MENKYYDLIILLIKNSPQKRQKKMNRMLFLWEDYEAECPALSVQAHSTVGAGDAMLAGFLYGYEQSGGDAVHALRWGTCAAGAVVFGDDPIRLYENVAAAELIAP